MWLEKLQPITHRLWFQLKTSWIIRVRARRHWNTIQYHRLQHDQCQTLLSQTHKTSRYWDSVHFPGSVLHQIVKRHSEITHVITNVTAKDMIPGSTCQKWSFELDRNSDLIYMEIEIIIHWNDFNSSLYEKNQLTGEFLQWKRAVTLTAALLSSNLSLWRSWRRFPQLWGRRSQPAESQEPTRLS